MQRASDRQASTCEYFRFLIVSEFVFQRSAWRGFQWPTAFSYDDAWGPPARFLTPNKESGGCRDQSPSQRVKEEEGVKRLEYTTLLCPLIVFTSEMASASD